MHAHRTLTCLKTAFLLSTTLEAFTLLNTPPSRTRSSGSSLYSSTSPSQIVILGGGFAGIQAALTLDSLFQQQQQVDDKLKEAPRPQITLVDPKERFVFLPLLYELCVGDANVDEVAPTFRNLLLHTQNVQFVQGSVYGIDVDTCQVYITGPNKTTTKLLSYDSLILATGSDSTDFTSISGATKDLIFPFYTLEDCYRLRRVFQRLELSSQDIPSKEDSSTIPFKIVVVGGGYSGVELSLNVLQRLHKIFRSHKGPAAEAVTVEMTMLHRGSHVLEYATEYNQKVAVDRLKQAGIMVKTGTSVEAIVPSSTTTSRYSESIGVPPCQVQVTSLLKDEGSSSSSFLDADLVLWTAGAMRRNIPNVPGILNSKIPRDTKGRIVTDSYLKVKGSTSNPIFALGDCSRVVRSSSSPPHQILKPYPATAQVALQQATVVAWNVYSQTMNATEDILPFEYLDLGEMMSLGSEDASISSLQGKLQLEGKSASLLRRWIYALRMPTPRQALTALQSSFQQRLVQKKKYE